jgi:hypothetical protein
LSRSTSAISARASAAESTALHEALYQSMRAIWAEVAFTHPTFKQVALQLSKEGVAKLGIAEP